MSVEPGDWVRTKRHRHHGKVLTVYPDCPENELWKQTQNLSEQEMDGPWALLFAPPAGSVVVPVGDCEAAEPLQADDLPDTIVIEAFGPTEEEEQQIAESLASMPGDGLVHQRKILVPPPELGYDTALQQMTELLKELAPTKEGDTDE